MAGPTIQVFGTPGSQTSRAALRFFKERRLEVHFVDITRKPMAPAELRRFIGSLGARSLVDETSKAWRDAGLGFMRLDDAELADHLLNHQRLLNIPLVRIGNAVAAGKNESAWKSMLALVPSR